METHPKARSKYHGTLHDVFISFRGQDTRKNFVSHLHAALANDGIKVFIDDHGLQKGAEISLSLRQAIQGSRMSLIVFSKNYAASMWCLKELIEIMECHTEGMMVEPIFYNVTPSEVRHRISNFGEAFEALTHKRSPSDDQVMEWREALRSAANLSGWDTAAYRYDQDMIDNIVQEVTRKLNKELLFVAEYPVGIESRVYDMITILQRENSDAHVLVLGLWGMGGLGKTTIAKAIYNEIGHEYRHKSFLGNIRETWQEENGKVNLQERLLSNILRRRGVKVQGVEFGKIKIKESLRGKRSLVVLDDINSVDQLFALSGRGEWLGPGSILIITTRDERLLKFSGLKFVHVHKMEGLNESESLELFSWHAFNQEYPEYNFSELSRNVVDYCCRLPLALEVLGSHFSEREISFWEDELAKLKRIPHGEIKKILKISYDGLSDNTQKEIFLHLTCFFIDKDRNYVMQILNECGLRAQNGITILKERSLITIDKENKLGMHDLLRDMGRDIIRDQSPSEPGERSRLWYQEEVLDVLEKHKGTKVIKGLTLSLPRTHVVCLSTEAFKKMKRLKLLQLSNVKLDGDYKYLSKDLRWLCWHGFVLSFLPANLYQDSLVAIDLKYSNLKILWKKPQLLEKMKILNLSHSCSLTRTPDFSKLPNLERLILKGCHSLSTVHHTIGDLKNLLFVKLKDCTNLVDLPRSIYKLKCLKTLIISGCSKIDKLEEDIEQMESLTILMADNTAIKQVPFSIVRSKSIAYISLCGHEGSSVSVFPSLISSWMSPTNYPNSLETFGTMSSLVSAGLHRDSFDGLLSMLYDIPKLRSLWVQCPQKLLTQDVARILDEFQVSHYLEMEATPRASQITSAEISASVDNQDQNQISCSENSLNYLLIQMGVDDKFIDAIRECILQGPFINVGDNYPYWQTYMGDGSSILFKFPQVCGFTLKGMIFHILYSFNCMVNLQSDCLKVLLIINATKGIIQFHKRDAITSFEDEEWQNMVSNLEPGDEVKVIAVFGDKFIVKNTRIYLVYGELKEEREDLTLEDNNALFSIDENSKCLTALKSKRSASDDKDEEECFTRATKAKKMC